MFPNNQFFNASHTQLNENVLDFIQQQQEQQQQQQQPSGQGFLLGPSPTSSASISSSYINSSHPPNHSQHPSLSQSSTSPQQPQNLQVHQSHPHSPSQPHPQSQQPFHPPSHQFRRQRSFPDNEAQIQIQIQTQELTRHHPQSNPQTQHPSQVAPSPQQQHSMHFSMVSPMMIGTLSEPSSPSFSVIKTENSLQSQNLEYMMYPTFDMHSSPMSQPQQHHILPSQRSPHGLSPQQHQRMMQQSYNDVSLFHQRHQNQQHTMRLQQQQQQQRAMEQHSYSLHHSSQQLMYESAASSTAGRSAISSAMPMSMPLSVSIPVTSSSALMGNSPTSSASSAHLFTPTSVPTSLPFLGTSATSSASSLSKEALMSSLQYQQQQQQQQHSPLPKRPHSSQGIYSSLTTGSMLTTDNNNGSSVHPASPRRKRQGSSHYHQPQFALAQLSPNSIGSAAAPLPDFSCSLGTTATPQNTLAAATAAGMMSNSMTPSTSLMAATTGGSAKRPRSISAAAAPTGRGSLLGSHVDDESNPRGTKFARTSSSSTGPGNIKSTTTRTLRRMTETYPSNYTQVPASIAAAAAVAATTATATATSTSTSTSTSASTTATSTSTSTSTAIATASSAGPVRTNVTHPRRAAQNRAAQRTFRNRRKAYIKDMEQKVLELHQIRSQFELLQQENREIWRRFRTVESILVTQNNHNAECGHTITPLPQFPPMTPFFETEEGMAAAEAAATRAAAAAEAANANATGGNVSTMNRSLSRESHQSHQSHNSSDEVDGEGEDETVYPFIKHEGVDERIQDIYIHGQDNNRDG
ncbi:hypothetical protein BX616_006063, partial [Lobosporangium transversale]